MSGEIEKFCDEKWKAAMQEFNNIFAMDYAEFRAEASGFHPDYFMPVGMEYTREWPRLCSKASREGD